MLSAENSAPKRARIAGGKASVRGNGFNAAGVWLWRRGVVALAGENRVMSSLALRNVKKASRKAALKAAKKRKIKIRSRA